MEQELIPWGNLTEEQKEEFRRIAHDNPRIPNDSADTKDPMVVIEPEDHMEGYSFNTDMMKYAGTAIRIEGHGERYGGWSWWRGWFVTIEEYRQVTEPSSVDTSAMLSLFN